MVTPYLSSRVLTVSRPGRTPGQSRGPREVGARAPPGGARTQGAGRDAGQRAEATGGAHTGAGAPADDRDAQTDWERRYGGDDPVDGRDGGGDGPGRPPLHADVRDGGGDGPWRPPPYTDGAWPRGGGGDGGSPIRTDESGLEDDGKEIKLLILLKIETGLVFVLEQELRLVLEQQRSLVIGLGLPQIVFEFQNLGLKS